MAAQWTGDYVTSVLVFRAGKRSAQASAHPLSQVQGEFLTFVTLRLSAFVSFCESSDWDQLWLSLRLNEIHEVRTFAPCKVFFDSFLLFFRHMKITLDSEQPMLE